MLIPGAKFGVYQQLSELILALSQLAYFLLALIVRSFLDVLFVDLFAFLRCQQQVTTVKHDLVQLFLPRREHRHLRATPARCNNSITDTYTPHRHGVIIASPTPTRTPPRCNNSNTDSYTHTSTV